MILCFYIDIRDMEGAAGADVQNYIGQVKQAMSEQIAGQGDGANDVVAFFIPIKGESRIECINPVLVTEQEAIDTFNKSMEQFQDLNFRLEKQIINNREKDEKAEE